MKQKLLPDILKELINGSTFTVGYNYLTADGSNTYTLSGICDLHHIQPASKIIINSVEYKVKEYDKDLKTITVTGTPQPPDVGVIILQRPYFIHGTPIAANTEAGKTPLEIKTPLIYLMEPFDTYVNNDFNTSIYANCKFTLCFLTQAKTQKWRTDDFYYNAIRPMANLAEDFINILNNSNLFFNDRTSYNIKYYTKFGINIAGLGVKKLYFSENLSGVGVDLSVDIYKLDECCVIKPPTILDIELREDGTYELREDSDLELREST